MLMASKTFWIILLVLHFVTATNPTKPHIIFILADDLGYNDIGFHGSDQIPTPNIDAISAYGISLNRYYTGPLCTPSRSSLMTGKYPSNIGMQSYVIPSDEPWGLGLSEKILPEYMKDGGYSTHIIGKWHLGFYQKKYTPCMRGFDSHFGILGSEIDYYNHSSSIKIFNGYDMRKDFNIDYDSNGTYSTDLFTNVAIQTIQDHQINDPLFLFLSYTAPHTGNAYDPLQVPSDEVAKVMHIVDSNRRLYAAMVSRLDVSVGKIVTALRNNNMLDNSVIIFASDNGAPVTGNRMNSGSNYPFKGQKSSPWEGAVHGIASIWSPHLQNRQRISKQLVHISDWLPTFANLAGVTLNSSLDGHNVWDSLSLNTVSPRSEVLCHIDQSIPYSSYIRDQWKYVKGTTAEAAYDTWFPNNMNEKHQSFQNYGQSVINSEVGQALSSYSQGLTAAGIEALRENGKVICQNNVNDESAKCNALISPCLFNILEDPCEQVNLASQFPSVVKAMEEQLDRFYKSSVPSRRTNADQRSDPRSFNGTWTWWYDELELDDQGNTSMSLWGKSYVNLLFMGAFCVCYNWIYVF